MSILEGGDREHGSHLPRQRLESWGEARANMIEEVSQLDGEQQQEEPHDDAAGSIFDFDA